MLQGLNFGLLDIPYGISRVLFPFLAGRVREVSLTFPRRSRQRGWRRDLVVSQGAKAFDASAEFCTGLYTKFWLITLWCNWLKADPSADWLKADPPNFSSSIWRNIGSHTCCTASAGIPEIINWCRQRFGWVTRETDSRRAGAKGCVKNVRAFPPNISGFTASPTFPSNKVSLNAWELKWTYFIYFRMPFGSRVPTPYIGNFYSRGKPSEIWIPRVMKIVYFPFVSIP